MTESKITGPLLSIEQLSIQFSQGSKHHNAVNHLDLTINTGEIVALVGESGSGKSLSAQAILQLSDDHVGKKTTGNIYFEQQDLLTASEMQLQQIRGNDIAMIFQEPMTAFNPLQRIGKQIAENIRDIDDKTALKNKVLELLRAVKLKDVENKYNAYPHQLSGGQRQRAMIAMAIANSPKLLIADEPTTALDVTVQQAIIDLLKDIQQQYGMAILLISHDLAMVKRMAKRIYVMQQGRCVEHGSNNDIFNQPKHYYTQSLIKDTPVKYLCEAGTTRLLSTTNLNVYYPLPKRSPWDKRQFQAVKNAEISLYNQHNIGIIGESGSGKSSLANALLKLIPSQGEICFLNQQVNNYNEKQFRPLRQALQVVFQDPFASLSPRLTIRDIIGEALQKNLPKAQKQQKIEQTMQSVGLDSSWQHRFSHEFSGGQRQRIAIARAIINEPKVLILDEPTSALDKNIQQQVLELLATLQQRTGMSYLCISHDINSMRHFCHDLLVMHNGEIVESGSSEQVYNQPAHPYTQQLIEASKQ